MEGGVHALQGVFRAAGDARVLCLVNPPMSSSACGQAMVIPGARRMCMCCPNLCPFVGVHSIHSNCHSNSPTPPEAEWGLSRACQACIFALTHSVHTTTYTRHL